MRSQSVAPHGVQTPSVRHAPSVRANDWEDVIDVAKAYGLVLDEWQENVCEAAMGVRSDGQWATPRVGVSVPRQNGKGALIEARELAGLLVFGEQSIVHSAHQQQTARVGFDRVLTYFENFDDLRKKVRKVSTALARESIELKSGQILRFPARKKATIRGFSIDLLILDEAQIFGDAALQAVQPTMAARPNPQMWLLGTPPTPLDDGAVFTRWRQSGLEGKDRRLCWCEWSAKSGCDLDDREAWAAANPALGIRIGYEAVTDERAAMDDAGFARERLGMWDEAIAEHVIDAATWGACADSKSKPSSDVAFGVDMSPSRKTVSIAAASVNRDGLTHVEVVENRHGNPDWVVPWLMERQAKWRPRAVVIDRKSPAWSLVDDLERQSVKVTGTNAGEMTSACGQFYDAVVTKQLRHLDQGGLNIALASARKRSIPDTGAWAWNRKDADTDITPLVAATLAFWGMSAAKIKRKTGRATFV